jgi:hypothetical protein
MRNSLYNAKCDSYNNGSVMVYLVVQTTIQKKEPVPNLERCVINIMAILANSLKLQGKANVSRIKGWKKLATDGLKLNVDASYMSDLGLGSTGASLRDSGGNFIAACYESNDHAIDVGAMEVAALLVGLQLAKELGCHSLSVESDSMEVVEAFLNPFEFRRTGVVIIDDCRQLLASLGMATIRHCP